jgi:mannose-6-phosphate isomerase-like protein (cupin superfamily)
MHRLDSAGRAFPDRLEHTWMVPMDAPFCAPKIVPKPWGREIWYAHEERYAGKVLEVTAGHALSLQKHERKQETLYLQSGRMVFHLNGHDHEMRPGDCLTVHPGDVHRMEALEDSVLLEVSTPELDDVIRLEDRYGRS